MALQGYRPSAPALIRGGNPGSSNGRLAIFATPGPCTSDRGSSYNETGLPEMVPAAGFEPAL